MDLCSEQDGVVGRRQLLATGWTEGDIRRALRRRDLARLHPGAYLNHTGTPTWRQRAWAALVSISREVDLADVALSHRSALRVVEGKGHRRSKDPIHVALRWERRLKPPPGVVLHRTRSFDLRVARHRHPPRIRYEDAVLDVAATESVMDSLAVLARAVGERRTTAARLQGSLETRPRIARRTWLTQVLTDIDQGTHSVLESGFLTEVTRPHDLPDPRRQLREVTAIGVTYRDAFYGSLLVELDGRLHAAFDKRDADLDRDLIAAASGRRTVRLGWGQVFDRPCFTAARLSEIIGDRRSRPCGPQCVVGSSAVAR